MYMEILFIGMVCVVIIILINNRNLTVKAKAAEEERSRTAKAKAAEEERILKAKAEAEAAEEERIRTAIAKAAKEERIRKAKAETKAAEEKRILQAKASPIRISGQLCPICGGLTVDVYKDGRGDCTSCRYTSVKHKNKMLANSRADLLNGRSDLFDEKPERGWW